MGRVAVTLKATTNRVVFHRVENAIYNALGHAIERTLMHGELVAKKHAPVRKVTRRGGRPTTRDMTDLEIADLPDDVKKAISPLSGNFIGTGQRPRITTRRSRAGHERPSSRIRGKTYRSPANAREVRIDRNTGERSMTNPKIVQLLSSRGRRELEGGRAGGGTNLDGVFIKRFVHEERSTRVNPRTGEKSTHSRIRHGYRATLGGRLKDEIKGFMLKVGVISEGVLSSPTPYARYVEFPTSRTAAQPYMRPARAAMETRLPIEAARALDRVAQYAGR